MGDGDRDHGAQEEVEAVELRPLLQRLAPGVGPPGRSHGIRLHETALVVMAEGDDNARNG